MQQKSSRLILPVLEGDVATKVSFVVFFFIDISALNIQRFGYLNKSC
jgi:hypothetical protein